MYILIFASTPVGGGPSCICLTPVVMVAIEVGGAGDILFGCGWEGPGGGGPIVIAPLGGGGGPADDKLVGGGALEEGGGGCW